MTVTAYIALGSNLGDRKGNLDQALALLTQLPQSTLGRVSSYQETEPVGGPPGQGKYLNAAAELRTSLSAPELLRALLEVEKKMGRQRGARFGPRTIDLDLVLYGLEQLKLPEADLEVPHPRMHERLFVLGPLAEIAPLAVHPRLESTIKDLLEALRSGGQTRGRELVGLRAMVTGSTSGIGRAIVIELAAAGADVLVHGRRSGEQARELAQELRGCGVRSEALLTDLADELACLGLAEKAWKQWNGLDIWINNAGADTLTGEAGRWSFEKKLAALWAVDVRATVILARWIGRHMKEQGHGVILNMGWDQAETGMEGESGELFAASKGAVMAFTKSLALSLAPEVRVNSLAPGWIKTAWGTRASARWQQRVRRETPLGRWGTPEDVARTARWLVSPAAAFITGQVIRINGGGVRG
jgi:2-amino-4-hydroxy-6-hydroxymethyldihydropteridine diphosphokinase